MGQSQLEKKLEKEVFENLPEWCKNILKFTEKYKHLYKSDALKNKTKK